MDGHREGQEEEVFSEPEQGAEWAELIMSQDIRKHMPLQLLAGGGNPS